jgi:hypothetical protein
MNIVDVERLLTIWLQAGLVSSIITDQALHHLDEQP